MLSKPSPESLLNLAAIERHRGAKSLSRFIRYAWHQVEPGPFTHGWHIDAISEHLEAVTRGEIRNLLINMPPRHMKSLSVSVFWPAWVWASLPAFRFLGGSYDKNLATRDATSSRRLILSPWYQERWGDVYQLAGDQNVKSRYQNDQGGWRIALGVGSGATGDGGDVILVDDPLSAMQAKSEKFLDRAKTWWSETMSSRLNDAKTGRKVIVMQRLHELDLAGIVLESGDYVHLCLPTEYDPKLFLDINGNPLSSYKPAPNPLSWKDPRTQPGELLWPERFGPDEVAAAKRDLKAYGFAGQHQQKPSPAEGGAIKKAWWQRYEVAPAKFDRIVISWDLSFDDGGDYSVGVVIGALGADRYVLDLVREQADFPNQVRAFSDQVAKWPKARARLVEKKANGAALIKSLKSKISGIIAFNPEGSKEQRLAAIAPDIQAGNWYLPASASWVHDLVEEFGAFPNGSNDDQIDAITQAGIYLQQAAPTVADYEKMRQAAAAAKRKRR